MTPAIRKTDEGFALTHRALTLIGSLVTIGVIFVGIGAAKGAATEQLKGKVDRSEFTAERAATDGRITRDSVRISVVEQRSSAGQERIESKLDSLSLRLTQYICDNESVHRSYCR